MNFIRMNRSRKGTPYRRSQLNPKKILQNEALPFSLLLEHRSEYSSGVKGSLVILGAIEAQVSPTLGGFMRFINALILVIN